VPRRKSTTIIPLGSICAISSGHLSRDGLIVRIAARQLSLITTAQLVAAGLNSQAIARRVRSGLLTRVHVGVYMVGPSLWPPGARELAAVLALGDSSLVSHRSALVLWGIVSPADSDVDVTLIGTARRSRRGIRVHRVAELPTEERRLRNGIPVTSPPRALLGFAAQAEPDDLERAIAEAYALKLASERELERILDRHPLCGGAAALRAELRRERGPALTRSKAERLMKALIREAKLPTPHVNRMVAGFQADFFWPDQRLIVEVDGYQFHSHRQAFERDRKRDAAHTLAGYRVIRITWRQLTEERVAVAAILARALAM
jgi:very-short-patch-repair endonuclease